MLRPFVLRADRPRCLYIGLHLGRAGMPHTYTAVVFKVGAARGASANWREDEGKWFLKKFFLKIKSNYYVYYY